MKKQLEKLSNQIKLSIEALNLVGAPEVDFTSAYKIKNELDSINIIIIGDPAKKELQEAYAPGLDDRVDKALWGIIQTTEGPTQTHKDDIAIIESKTKKILQEFDRLSKDEIAKLNARLKELKAPYIPE